MEAFPVFSQIKTDLRSGRDAHIFVENRPPDFRAASDVDTIHDHRFLQVTEAVDVDTVANQ